MILQSLGKLPGFQVDKVHTLHSCEYSALKNRLKPNHELPKSRLALDGFDVFFGATPKEVSALSDPQAAPGKLPAIAKFWAAFKSRFDSQLHFSHRSTRTDNGIESLT
jgi:hypothetical protein|nr:hypothetical protein [Lyngbya sp. CCY1209]